MRLIHKHITNNININLQEVNLQDALSTGSSSEAYHPALLKLFIF
jgi:hypothetical protein